jgi:hypothetical protein
VGEGARVGAASVGVNVDVAVTAGVNVTASVGLLVDVGVTVGVGVAVERGGITSIGSPGRTTARQPAKRVSETPLPRAITSPSNTVTVVTSSLINISSSVPVIAGVATKSVTIMRNSEGTSKRTPRA